MASSTLKCFICLDHFIDPVSTPCGHNFCKHCIDSRWKLAKLIHCPLCQQSFKKRPKLRVNVLLRDLIEQKQANARSVMAERSHADGVLCDACAGEKQEVMAVKSCLFCEESLCGEHLKPHLEDPRMGEHQLLDPVSSLKDWICKQHKSPLELVCEHEMTSVCALCVTTNHKNHPCLPLKKRLGWKKDQMEQALAEVQQEIKHRRNLLEKVQKSKEINETNRSEDMADVLRIFIQLQQLIGMKECGFMAALTSLHEKAASRTEALEEKLRKELRTLEEREDKLEHLCQTGDDLNLLQSWSSLNDPPIMTDWSEISVYSDSAVKIVRYAVVELLHKLHSQISREKRRLMAKEIKRIQQYAVDVTVNWEISNDGKQVRIRGFQELPDHSEKSDSPPGVLGKEGFSSGAFYFEVQVKGKTAWDVGVAVETAERKHETKVCLGSGYVVLMLSSGTLRACDRPPMDLNVAVVPEKVGVFVDQEQGLVCFYDVGNKAHIYSFTRCRFAQKKLHPYFNPWRH